MEFPHLGQHCSESSCNRLDFLPVKCDSCDKVFCGDHMLYARHQCESAYKKDIQVPVCPLCNQPVPIKRGELPDVSVGAHIDRDCQWDPALKKRIYVNKCYVKSCKTKEIVKVTCRYCNLNFCLKHRHTADHSCEKVNSKEQNGVINKPSSTRSNSTREPRVSNSTRENYATHAQNLVSEDEALAQAIHLSLNDNTPPQSNLRFSTDQDFEEDLNLAKALAESENEYQRQLEAKKDKCAIV